MSPREDHASSPPAQRWTKAGPLAVSMPAEDVQRLQEAQEVTTAVPAPLGLFGFATGTIAIGYVLSGFTASTAQIGTVPALLVFAGLAQFIAGLWALVPGFTLSGLGLVGEPEIIGHVGGYWLIASVVLAFYAAGALVINSVYRRTVLPLFGKA